MAASVQRVRARPLSVSSGDAEHPTIAPLKAKAAPRSIRTVPQVAHAKAEVRAAAVRAEVEASLDHAGRPRARERSRSRSPRRAPSRHHQSDGDVALSKLMSYVLRHGAEKEGISLDENGFARVADVNKRFKKLTYQVMRRITDNDQKGRYELLRYEDGPSLIRAVQGHSDHVAIRDDTAMREVISSGPRAARPTMHRAWNDPL